MKKFFIFVVIVLVIALIGGIYLYSNREKFIQLSIDNIVKNKLPKFMEVDSVKFYLDKGILEVKGIRIKNSKNFSKKYFLQIDKAEAEYKQKTENILDGINITKLTAFNMVINIEREEYSNMNVASLGDVIKFENRPISVTEKRNIIMDKISEFSKDKNISDYLEITRDIDMVNGTINFIDSFVSYPSFVSSFNGINGKINLTLNDNYSEVLYVLAIGDGYVNNDKSQKISYKISLDPTTEKLKLSNVVILENVDATEFEVYYYKFLPIVVDSGRVSGTLDFSLDQGNIGSSNELFVRNFAFRKKPDATAAKYWSFALNDMIKYLSLSPGEAVFDFKIKGTIENPEFHAGNRVKKAIQNMTVDKLAGIIKGINGEPQTQQGAEIQGQKTNDVDKVMNVIKGLFGEN